MICNNCRNKPICIHTEYFKRYDYLDISSCKYINEIKTWSEDKIETLESLQKPMKLEVLKPFSPKKAPGLFEPTEEFPDLKGDPVECPNCSRNTYDKLIKCHECGTETCGMCSNPDITVDSFGYETIITLCDNCFNKLHEDDIEIEDDGLSLYESLAKDLIGDDNIDE